ncbi:alpha/beta fold hydrolase [Pseudonocardia eucalypti]|uniref:Alpha/beta fold hydrolase n=1 Tax=Pseudonocardia eucalypti TaxID=648755 RepID=A0ABP9PV54_9PSEU|nr:pimeloyl-ACP methyl ester carboxylesterase [Pseudonocardia eucalypti]
MTVARLNGVSLSYRASGDGELVVLVMGTGSPGRVWHLHQVPALVAAGYRVVTYDARGLGGSSPADRLTIEDLVADLAALIEHLGGGPARVVGTSLGARVVQELALERPDLVRRAVAMAGHARLDPVQRAYTRGQQELFDQKVVLPAPYHAAVTAALNLSPATLRNESAVRDWLDIFELSSAPMPAGERAQLAVSSHLDDRRAAYRDIRVPTLVIGFADDVMIPTYLCREVADAIPGARYLEIPDTGHFGYLERPEEVNRLLVDFLKD